MKAGKYFMMRKSIERGEGRDIGRKRDTREGGKKIEKEGKREREIEQ